MDDRSQMLSYLEGSSNTSSDREERAIDDAINHYGMIKQNKGLVSMCKQCLAELRHSKLREEGLRPFVIPTVVSNTRDGEGKGSTAVDITPRLVTYFEVTIIDKEGQKDASRNAAMSHQAHRNQNGGMIAPPPRRRAHQMQQDFRNYLRIPHLAARTLHFPAPLDVAAEYQPQPHPQDRGADQRNNENQQSHECVAIGLSTKSFSPDDRMPGWDDESFGYHGDDGGIFHGQGETVRRFGPSFGKGDTVGCGLEYSTRKLFFVKNGKFLGYAFDGKALDRDMVDRGLYPTVGVDTECPIFVNFGEKPFRFDLKGFAAYGTATDY